MAFEDLISAEDEAEFRKAIGDVASATFGQHDVTFITKTLTPTEFGETPDEEETSKALKGLIITPDAMIEEGTDRSQIDWDLTIMFYRDYLSDEGVLTLIEPGDADRTWEFNIDGLRYTVKKIRYDAQFKIDYLLVFFDVERI